MDIYKKMKNSNQENIYVRNKARYLVFAFTIICIALNVVLSVNMSKIGLEMADLEKDIAEAKQTEKELRYNLISNSSLLKMEDYAKRNDFAKPTDVVYVKDEFNGLAKLP